MRIGSVIIIYFILNTFTYFTQSTILPLLTKVDDGKKISTVQKIVSAPVIPIISAVTEGKEEESSKQSGKQSATLSVSSVKTGQINQVSQSTVSNVYVIVQNYLKDSEAMLVYNYLKNTFGSIFANAKVLQVSRCIISNGTNYQYQILVKYTTTVQLKYLITVCYSSSKKFQLVKTEYEDIGLLDTTKLKHYAKGTDAPFYNNINQLLKRTVDAKYKKYSIIVSADVNEPYYLFIYKATDNTTIKVTLIYDVIRAAITIISITDQSIQTVVKSTTQTVTQTPTVSQTPAATPVPTSSLADFKTPISAIGQPPITLATPQPITTTTTSTNTPPLIVLPPPTPLPEVSPAPAAQPQQTTPPTETPIQVSQVSPQLIPMYTISLKNTWIIQLQTTSDSALIPFLTASYDQELNQDKINTIINFIIDKASITQQFTVILINQIRYAVRIVLIISDTNEIYEALVTYTYKNGDISSAQMQLLQWQQIDNIVDIDPDVFTKYYSIGTEIVSGQLSDLIMRAFKNQESIAQFKQLVKIEEKVSFDGVYFRVVLDSLSSIRYQIVLYWVPQIDFLQILKYQFVESGYNASQQKIINESLLSDKYYDAAKSNILKSFQGILNDSSIIYVASFSTGTLKYYRFVFEGATGRYEAILTVNVDSMVVMVVRWEKLEEGYISQSMDGLQNDAYFKQIIAFSQTYLNAKISNGLIPTFLSYKLVPGFCKFFKLMYSLPFPFILIMDDKDMYGGMTIRGLQRIQIIPANIYYNDRLFAGYSLLNIQQLKYDSIYQAFLRVLISGNQGITDKNSIVVAAFKDEVPSGMYYKIIYQMIETSQLMLVTFFYDYGTEEYRVISVSQYTQQIEPGDYRWKCISYNTATGICSACQSSQYLLTAGRCYSQLDGCALQMASTCFSCFPGYIKIGVVCDNSPASVFSITSETVDSQTTTIVTSTGSYTTTTQQNSSQSSFLTKLSQLQLISLSSFEGDICIKYNGSVCILCAYRFYASNGDCIKVQDQCKQYDNSSGICYNCYTAYYLDLAGVCQALSPQCVSANPNGACTGCYQGYDLINGQCIVNVVTSFQNGVKTITSSTQQVSAIYNTTFISN